MFSGLCKAHHNPKFRFHTANADGTEAVRHIPREYVVAPQFNEPAHLREQEPKTVQVQTLLNGYSLWPTKMVMPELDDAELHAADFLDNSVFVKGTYMHKDLVKSAVRSRKMPIKPSAWATMKKSVTKTFEKPNAEFTDFDRKGSKLGIFEEKYKIKNYEQFMDRWQATEEPQVFKNKLSKRLEEAVGDPTDGIYSFAKLLKQKSVAFKNLDVNKAHLMLDDHPETIARNELNHVKSLENEERRRRVNDNEVAAGRLPSAEYLLERQQSRQASTQSEKRTLVLKMDGKNEDTTEDITDTDSSLQSSNSAVFTKAPSFGDLFMTMFGSKATISGDVEASKLPIVVEEDNSGVALSGGSASYESVDESS